jgi:hypothetical protein
LPPNQSLKLTEPAVDDFARAKHPVTIGLDLSRADWIPSLRTSLPQLSSGPLGGQTKAFMDTIITKSELVLLNQMTSHLKRLVVSQSKITKFRARLLKESRVSPKLSGEIKQLRNSVEIHASAIFNCIDQLMNGTRKRAAKFFKVDLETGKLLPTSEFSQIEDKSIISTYEDSAKMILLFPKTIIDLALETINMKGSVSRHSLLTTTAKLVELAKTAAFDYVHFSGTMLLVLKSVTGIDFDAQVTQAFIAPIDKAALIALLDRLIVQTQLALKTATFSLTLTAELRKVLNES